MTDKTKTLFFPLPHDLRRAITGGSFDCDCCGRPTPRHHVQQCWTPSGLEAWACPECRGEEPEDYDGDDK